MKNSESLGKGIIILSVLNLISLICVGAFVMFVILVGSTNFEGQLATMNMTPMVPFIIVLIAGVIMILRKNKLGTRHRTAERVAIQTGAAVIAISQRRNVISVYRGDQKYVVEEISKIFTKANQALQTLEKYKAVLDQAVINLNALEFNDLVTIYDVALVIQKMEMVMRITSIIEKYVIELGIEGQLVSMQFEELMGTTKSDQKLIFKDYSSSDGDIKDFKMKIKDLSSEDLIDLVNIAKILGYSGFSENMDMPIRTRGYRILNKIHRLPTTIIENLVNYFDNFQEILKASIEDLDDVEGIGEIRATYIKNGLIKMQQLVLLDRHI